MLNVPLPPADVNDPIGVGEPKFPKLSESSAVKMLAGLFGKGQLELRVNGTVREAPWQNDVAANEGALIPTAFTVSVVALCKIKPAVGLELVTRTLYVLVADTRE